MPDFDTPQYGYSPPPPRFDGPPGPPRILRPRTSGKAIASIFLALMGFVFWIFTGLPAILLALIAKSEIRADPERLKGRGLANFGLAFGILSLVVPFVLIPFMFGLLIGGSTDHVPAGRDRIAHFHLSGTVFETPVDTLGGFFGYEGVSLGGLIDALESAAQDDSVRAVILTVESPAFGLGQIEELWAAIEAFKDTGKEVYAHGAGLQTGTYALLSAATQLNVIPTDSVWLTGLYMQGLYLKDSLEKIGVKADMLHMGEYKSAGEMFANSAPSPAAEENMNWLLDGLYDRLVDMIAQSRELSTERVKELIDGGPYTAAGALDAGLVDSVMFLDDFLDQIRDVYGDDIYIDNEYGLDDGGGRQDQNPFTAFGFFDNSDGDGLFSKKRDGVVAVVYVEGAIVQGFGDTSPFAPTAAAFSGDLVRRLHHAAESEEIDAVVLRIDSPGGSVVASEQILDAARKVKEEKPLIVSMGSTAASGGYYVACEANAIFADATTITASIGVVGGKIVLGEMWDELGVNWVGYKRGAQADIFDSSRSFNDDERRRMIDLMQDAYSAFKGHVVEGRGDKLAHPIDELAAGRVFTGAQALELGLVDHLGGLADAIAFAADLASLEDYDVRVLPEPQEFFQALMQSLSGGGERPSDLRFDGRAPPHARSGLRGLASGAMPSPVRGAATLLDGLDPQRARAMLQALTAAELLRSEGAIAMMPRIFVVD